MKPPLSRWPYTRIQGCPVQKFTGQSPEERRQDNQKKEKKNDFKIN
jgi:hypothetical protein